MTQARVAVAAVVVLMATAITTTGMAMQTAAPCSAPIPPSLPKPAAPTGLRILSGGGDFLEFDQTSGPNAGADSEVVTVAAAATAAGNAYFDELVKRPDCQIAYSLRAQAQIDQYKNRTGEVKVNYDAVMDAAKWSWIKDDESAENIRMPIKLERPATGTSRLLIISDHRWDASWFTEFKMPNGDYMGGWKWMQITCASADSMSPTPNSKQRICVEPQMVGLGALNQSGSWFPGANPPVLSVFGVREYQGLRAPTTSDARCNGHYMGELLGPIANCFKAYANTWTRVWLDITMTAGDRFANFSMYMADENQAAVPVVLNAQVGINSPVLEFWYEYDTSREERSGGPMAAWGRNVIVLKDVANPSSLFQKPIR